MKLKLITIGKNMPHWVTLGFADYAKRLQAYCSFELIELALPKRCKNIAITSLIAKESKALLSKIKEDNYVIALDEQGSALTTHELSNQLQNWQQLGKDIVFLIGGPDGLSKECKTRAQFIWSLSNLTLPHPLARIIWVEQIYRAYSIGSGHPYHR